MYSRPSKKAVIFALTLTVTAALFFLIAGIFVTNDIKTIKTNCTAEVTGIVARSGTGKAPSEDPVETKYLTSTKYWRQIKVKTDNLFTTENIYVDRGKEKVDDHLTIFYDPKSPENYYLDDAPEYRTAIAVTLFTAFGIMILLMIFVIKMSLGK